MDGRRVTTWGKTGEGPPDTTISAFTTAAAGVTMRCAVAWSMGSIWVGLDDVRAAAAEGRDRGANTRPRPPLTSPTPVVHR